MKILYINFFLWIGLASGYLNAQSLDNWVIGSGGATSPSNQVQLNWTLGEPMVNAIQTQSGWVTEGFHQPYLQVVVLNDIAKVSEDSKIRVYPNPVNSELIIEPAVVSSANYNFVLTDMQGKIVEFGQIESGYQKVLNVNNLLPASYILLLRPESSEKNEVLQYKIIKQ